MRNGSIFFTSILLFGLCLFSTFSCTAGQGIGLTREEISGISEWGSFKAQGTISYRIGYDRYGADINLIYIKSKGLRVDILESITGKLLGRTVVRTDSLFMYNPIDKVCQIDTLTDAGISNMLDLPISVYDITLFLNGNFVTESMDSLNLKGNTIEWVRGNREYSLEISKHGSSQIVPSNLAKKADMKIIYLCKLRDYEFWGKEKPYAIPRTIRVEIASQDLLLEMRLDKIEIDGIEEKLLHPTLPKDTKVYNK
jgi:hypothetical protein